jgi:hypothetical protein
VYSDQEGTVDLAPPTKVKSKIATAAESDAMSLSYYIDVKHGIATIHVYSKFAFIDRTGGLDLCIQAKTAAGSNAVRKAFDAIGKSSLSSTDESVGDVGIKDMKFRSSKIYSVLSQMTPGCFVYSDRALVWHYLPPYLINSVSICTACDDKVREKLPQQASTNLCS